MAKQQIRQKETQVSGNGNHGKQLEQTVIVDDNCLPSPEELSAYRAIDARIVDFLMDISLKEQNHRHAMDCEKMNIIRKNERRATSINVAGMVFAFLSVVVLCLLTAFALYLDKSWIAGCMGGGVLITVVSIFVTRNRPK